MTGYTADAVALLSYLVDCLPPRADRVFAEAEAGETVIRVPSTALGETLYAVSRDKDVRGVTLTGSPERARRALVDDGPVSLSPIGSHELREFSPLVGELSLHDAFVVASHRADDTEAIVTTDDAIAEIGCRTIWG